jgi:serine/threonine-protein kinase
MVDTREQIAGLNVIDVLGHGASSTIYAVCDPDDQHLYALKRVTIRAKADERFAQQARNEAEVAGAVDHPAVRGVFRIIQRRKLIKVNELLVLMELVDGETLERRCGNLDIADQVSLFAQAAEGVQAIHDAGYVHCDLKPNNLMVTDSDGVKIIDLGQACPRDTVKQRIQGTPDYIAPEQVLRLSLTPRTDVFNLGATMYWCLTGKHIPTLIPKGGKEQIGLRQDRDLKPPAELNDAVPPALDALVLQCLNTEPNDRPASMKEVSARLQIVLKQLARAATAAVGEDGD